MMWTLCFHVHGVLLVSIMEPVVAQIEQMQTEGWEGPTTNLRRWSTHLERFPPLWVFDLLVLIDVW